MANSLEISFSADHPTAHGHFPGNPIIPGAVLLNRVLQTIAPDLACPFTIRSAKFLSPVKPGDHITIHCQVTPEDEIRFECRLQISGQLMLSGLVKFGSVS